MVADGYKETDIGVIPIEWDIVELRDIGKVSMCKRIMKDETTDCGEIPFYKIGTFGKEADAYINKELYEDYKNKYSFPKQGDILISASGTIGRLVIYNGEPGYFQDSNIVWIANQEEKLLNSLLFYVYKTVKWNTDGNTIARLYNENLRRIKIPLPPLKEQEKIANILSTADNKIDTIDSQIQKAETLKKGLLQKLLSEGIGHSAFKDSELGKIPESWEVVKLNDLGKIITGSTPKTSNQDFYLNGTRLWASPSDLGKSKEVKTTNTKLSNLGFEQIRVLEKRSILITCIGSTIGKMGIAYEEMSSNQQINAITCNEDNNPDFYYYVLFKIKDKIQKLAGTQAVPLLNKTDFSQIKIIKAPLEEQKQIADILSTADEKLEVLRAKKDKYETLKLGLLQQLLTGKTRVII